MKKYNVYETEKCYVLGRQWAMGHTTSYNSSQMYVFCADCARVGSIKIFAFTGSKPQVNVWKLLVEAEKYKKGGNSNDGIKI